MEDYGFERFSGERLVQDAVERCLLNISEAAVRLGQERFAAVAPDLPLHRLRGFGNLLRHDYRKVDARTVWDTATIHVPALREACAKALGEGE